MVCCVYGTELTRNLPGFAFGPERNICGRKTIGTLRWVTFLCDAGESTIEHKLDRIADLFHTISHSHCIASENQSHILPGVHHEPRDVLLGSKSPILYLASRTGDTGKS